MIVDKDDICIYWNVYIYASRFCFDIFPHACLTTWTYFGLGQSDPQVVMASHLIVASCLDLTFLTLGPAVTVWFLFVHRCNSSSGIRSIATGSIVKQQKAFHQTNDMRTYTWSRLHTRKRRHLDATLSRRTSWNIINSSRDQSDYHSNEMTRPCRFSLAICTLQAHL